MNCPKTIEIIWLLDGRLPKAQNENFEKHFEECEECSQVHKNCQMYFEGKSGMIIDSDNPSCVSDLLLVREIQLQNNPSDQKQLEDHLRSCKKCLKRFTKFYTGELDSSKILEKIKAEAQKTTLPGARGTVYGNKMDEVGWWKGGEFSFLGVRFSQFQVAIGAGLFVALGMLGLYFGTELFSRGVSSVKKDKPQGNEKKKGGKSAGANSEDKKEKDGERFVFNSTEKEKKPGIFLTILKGNCIRAQGKNRKVQGPGEVEIFESETLLVRQSQKAVFALRGASFTVFGPSRLSVYRQKKKIVVAVEKGTIFYQSYGKDLTFQFLLDQKDRKLKLTLGRGQMILEKNNQELLAYSLSNQIEIYSQTKKYIVKSGYFFKVAKGKVQEGEITELPSWYFKLYSRLSSVYQEDFQGKNSLSLVEKEGEMSQEGPEDEKYLKVTTANPAGFTLNSDSLSLGTSRAYRLYVRYKLYGEISKATLSLVGKHENKRSYFRSVRLKPAQEWRVVKALIFTPPTLNTQAPSFLRVSVLGKGRLEIDKIELSRFDLERQSLESIDFKSPSPLKAFRIDRGTFQIQGGKLHMKSTLRAGRLLSPRIKSHHYHGEMVLELPLPTAILLDYRDRENYRMIRVFPQQKEVAFVYRRKGIDYEVTRGELHGKAPYQMHLIRRGSLFILEVNGRTSFETIHEGQLTSGRVGLWVYPETKQVLSHFDFYRQ